MVVFINTQCVQTPGSEIPFLGLTPTEMHVQEAKDRCKRIFNIILFVRAKHFKQNKYSLGSNELGQLLAGNTGNHRTKRECVFAHTHTCTYTGLKECSVNKGLLWVHAWVHALYISTLLHDFVKALKKIYILKREEINLSKS